MFYKPLHLFILVLFIFGKFQGIKSRRLSLDCRPVISPDNGRISVRIGNSGTITCAIPQKCKFPVYGVFWSNPQGVFIGQDSVRISSSPLNDTATNLNYFQIKREDLGSYTCLSRISNSTARAYANIRFDLNIVKEIPVTTKRPVTEKPS
ncbi:hypothetical protein Ahia01_000122600 [Argonauta hians]